MRQCAPTHRDEQVFVGLPRHAQTERSTGGVQMDMTKRAAVQRGEVEYEIRGDGGCVLLIHGSLIADSFLPLMAETALANYCSIRYRRRGFAGSSAHEGPCSIE